jgi:hypothetical protein
MYPEGTSNPVSVPSIVNGSSTNSIPPQLVQLTPSSGQRGKTVRVTFEGANLEKASDIESSPGGISYEFVGNPTRAKVVCDIQFSP